MPWARRRSSTAWQTERGKARKRVNVGGAVAGFGTAPRCPDAVHAGRCVDCRLSWKLVHRVVRFWVGAGPSGTGALGLLPEDRGLGTHLPDVAGVAAAGP